MAISTYLSIITLNVNGLNAPMKRYRWLNGLKKKYRLKVKGWKQIFHANVTGKKSGVAILI